MLVKACKAGFCKQLVVAGQKSGWLWALNPDTGKTPAWLSPCRFHVPDATYSSMPVVPATQHQYCCRQQDQKLPLTGLTRCCQSTERLVLRHCARQPTHACKCTEPVSSQLTPTCLRCCHVKTGDVHWSVPVGPGGTVGGLQWGSAADNTRIYVSNNNYLSVNADLTKMKSVVNFPTTTNQLAPTSTDGGMAAAVDAYTGEILWTFANPTIGWDGSGKHARSQAPMTVVNDIVLYSSKFQHADCDTGSVA